MDNGKLTYYVRWVAGITAVLVAYGSAKLSVAGIGLQGDLWWLNWVVAVSLFVSEFMVNGRHKELSWTIMIVGIGAYAYSVATNIAGIQDYRNANGNSSSAMMDLVTIYAGGVFMDVYPELVLRWALGESKIGDLVGNIVKTWQNPNSLITSQPTQNATHHYGQQPTQHNNRGRDRRQELQEQYKVKGGHNTPEFTRESHYSVR